MKCISGENDFIQFPVDDRIRNHTTCSIGLVQPFIDQSPRNSSSGHLTLARGLPLIFQRLKLLDGDNPPSVTSPSLINEARSGLSADRRVGDITPADRARPQRSSERRTSHRPCDCRVGGGGGGVGGGSCYNTGL